MAAVTSGHPFEVLAKMKPIHVVPHDAAGWDVRKEGASRAERRFDTKHDAEVHARELYRTTGAPVVIHRRDGTVQRTIGARRLPAARVFQGKLAKKELRQTIRSVIRERASKEA
jgi:hypothetical protein